MRVSLQSFSLKLHFQSRINTPQALNTVSKFSPTSHFILFLIWCFIVSVLHNKIKCDTFIFLPSILRY